MYTKYQIIIIISIIVVVIVVVIAATIVIIIISIIFILVVTQASGAVGMTGGCCVPCSRAAPVRTSRWSGASWSPPEQLSRPAAAGASCSSVSRTPTTGSSVTTCSAWSSPSLQISCRLLPNLFPKAGQARKARVSMWQVVVMMLLLLMSAILG